MLAGEPFSDHPVSVCPVIGSFLRAYNDVVDETRRQDLYEYAAKVVGSSASADVLCARADHLAAWGSEMLERRWTRFLPHRAVRWITRLWKPPSIVWVGAYAANSISKPTDETHAAVLALIDELLAIGTGNETRSRPAGLGVSRPGAADAAASSVPGEVRSRSGR